MKVFLSWSKEPSRLVAEAVSDILQQLIPSLDVYLSAQDITSGERWLNSVGSNLEDAACGILFVTKENKSEPWLLFEAGALSKSVSTAKVIPLLCDCEEQDLLGSPLSQFQAKRLERDRVLEIAFDINRLLERPVQPDRLRRSFEAFWPEIEARVVAVQYNADTREAKKPNNDERLARLELTLLDLTKGVRQLTLSSNSRYETSAGEQVRVSDLPRRIQRLPFSTERAEYYVYADSAREAQWPVRRRADRKNIGYVSAKIGDKAAVELAQRLVEDYEARNEN